MVLDTTNQTVSCSCSPMCERIDYVVTLSQAELSQHTTHLLALSDNIPKNIEELSNIQDWASIGIRNKQYTSALYKLGQHMYIGHKKVIEARLNADNSLQMFESLEKKLPNLKNYFNRLLPSGQATIDKINELLNWIENSFFFNFKRSDINGETFNVRVAVDIIRQKNAMSKFFSDLLVEISNVQRLYSAYDGEVTFLQSAINDMNENSIITLMSEASSTTYLITKKIQHSLTLFHSMYTDFRQLQTAIIEDSLLLEYPHIMTPTSHQFYK